MIPFDNKKNFILMDIRECDPVILYIRFYLLVALFRRKNSFSIAQAKNEKGEKREMKNKQRRFSFSQFCGLNSLLRNGNAHTAKTFSFLSYF